jgi:hypothetical protein
MPRGLFGTILIGHARRSNRCVWQVAVEKLQLLDRCALCYAMPRPNLEGPAPGLLVDFLATVAPAAGGEAAELKTHPPLPLPGIHANGS